jgi:hypothetical protein
MVYLESQLLYFGPSFVGVLLFKMSPMHSAEMFCNVPKFKTVMHLRAKIHDREVLHGHEL